MHSLLLLSVVEYLRVYSFVGCLISIPHSGLRAKSHGTYFLTYSGTCDRWSEHHLTPCYLGT